MRWLKRVLFVVAALLLLIIGGLYALHAYEKRQVARFYEARPMLAQMTHFFSSDLKMMEILMNYVPVGSTYEQAFKVLSSQGMTCGPLKRNDFSSLACGVEDARGDVCTLIPRWSVDIYFDQNGKVSRGNVTPLKATC